ncbi:TPA: hypothetical protein ACH3X3_000411 [Trebouxia sp. C0006]
MSLYKKPTRISVLSERCTSLQVWRKVTREQLQGLHSGTSVCAAVAGDQRPGCPRGGFGRHQVHACTAAVRI